MGPVSSIKAVVNAVVGGFIPGAEFFPENERSRQELRILREEILIPLIKNPRFAIAEQKRLLKLVPDPDTFFANPETEAKKFASI